MGVHSCKPATLVTRRGRKLSCKNQDVHILRVFPTCSSTASWSRGAGAGLGCRYRLRQGAGAERRRKYGENDAGAELLMLLCK